MGADLDIPEARLQWVTSAYSLSSGCLLLFFGRLADLYGRRRAFLLGSTPFARFMAHGTRRQDLGDPGAELWMPVAWDVALCSVGHADYRAFLDVDDARIRKINGAVAGSSTVFASASRDLVEAYARTARRALKTHGPWEGP